MMGRKAVQTLTPTPTRARRRARGQRGFTMIELLVTMLLLTIVLTGLAALQIATTRQVSNGKRASEATRLAQMVMERLKSYSWSHVKLSTTGGNFVVTTNSDNRSMQSVRANGFNARTTGELDGPYTVQKMIESAGASRRIVTVKVTWLDTQKSADPANRYAVRSIILATHLSQ